VTYNSLADFLVRITSLNCHHAELNRERKLVESYIQTRLDLDARAW
jgi:hypothetical protein